MHEEATVVESVKVNLPRNGFVRVVLRALAILSLLGPVGCHHATSDSESQSAVEETLQRIIAADNRGDLEAIAGLYTSDAVLIPSGDDPVAGINAILHRYREGFSRFSMDVTLQTTETVVTGGWAYSRGKTTGRLIWHDGRPPAPLNDDYLMILERDRVGRWLIDRLIWNQAGS